MAWNPHPPKHTHTNTHRCRLLVAAVAPAELLDGLVRRPWELERDVQPPPAFAPRPDRRVEGDSGAGRVADDGHLLLARHEQTALGDVQAVRAM